MNIFEGDAYRCSHGHVRPMAMARRPPDYLSLVSDISGLILPS